MGDANRMCTVYSVNRLTRMRGFNLIELLVSLVVVAVSLFAIAKIQITGMQSVEGAKQSAGSTVSVASFIERLSLHREAVRTILDASTATPHSLTYLLKSLDDEALNGATSSACKGDLDQLKVDEATTSVVCEIDAWLYSVYNALNLKNPGDICAYISISDATDYKYKSNSSVSFRYAIPVVMVEYKWRQSPTSATSTDDFNCNLKDGHLIKPNLTYDSKDQSGEIGYSSMEYLLP